MSAAVFADVCSLDGLVGSAGQLLGFRAGLMNLKVAARRKSMKE